MTVFLRPLPDFIVTLPLTGFFNGVKGGSNNPHNKAFAINTEQAFCLKI
jgi:hypothetical protein